MSAAIGVAVGVAVAEGDGVAATAEDGLADGPIEAVGLGVGVVVGSADGVGDAVGLVSAAIAEPHGLPDELAPPFG